MVSMRGEKEIRKLKKNMVWRVILISLASLIMAVNINTFVHTGGLIPGGATGITLLLQEVALKFFGISLPFTVINLMINAIPVYIGFRFIGKRFTLLSCWVIFLTGILADILPYHMITQDPLLISVFGGLINDESNLKLLAESQVCNVLGIELHCEVFVQTVAINQCLIELADNGISLFVAEDFCCLELILQCGNELGGQFGHYGNVDSSAHTGNAFKRAGNLIEDFHLLIEGDGCVNNLFADFDSYLGDSGLADSAIFLCIFYHSGKCFLEDVKDVLIGDFGICDKLGNEIFSGHQGRIAFIQILGFLQNIDNCHDEGQLLGCSKSKLFATLDLDF